MADKHRKKHRYRSRRKPGIKHALKTGAVLAFCVVAFWGAALLWQAGLSMQTQQPTETGSEDEFRPQVGAPPYRVAVDAGHGGADPGARGVVEEKTMTAATAQELLRLLENDTNYIPLQIRNSFDETATPAQRAEIARQLAPQLLLSIHGNSAANGSSANGFECYPAVPGRTWHQESLYFAQLLAGGMQTAGAVLRGHGGIRYIYYLEGDRKQLVESTHTEIREERSFTILEDVDCPAVLAEQCFVTNEADVAQFGSEEGCKKTAQVYYEAICAYFGTQPTGS